MILLKSNLQTHFFSIRRWSAKAVWRAELRVNWPTLLLVHRLVSVIFSLPNISHKGQCCSGTESNWCGHGWRDVAAGDGAGGDHTTGDHNHKTGWELTTSGVFWKTFEGDMLQQNEGENQERGWGIQEKICLCTAVRWQKVPANNRVSEELVEMKTGECRALGK